MVRSGGANSNTSYTGSAPSKPAQRIAHAGDMSARNCGNLSSLSTISGGVMASPRTLFLVTNGALLQGVGPLLELGIVRVGQRRLLHHAFRDRAQLPGVQFA